MNRPVRIGVVDYGMGNRRSVQKALEHIGAEATITGELEQLQAADGLVVPGVGAFPVAMRNLTDLGLAELIAEHAAQSRPVLGICLGMQLLFESSEELGHTVGLGLIPGEVRWLQTGGLRIPHIGWNEARFEQSSPLLSGLPPGGCPFYHVHSLAAWPVSPQDVIATCEYGERFPTIVARGSVLGVQFHPEKSSAHGLTMLENFVRRCAERTAGTVAAARA
jgi:imidazole glycerol-phosphate synthase subunit HisH